MGRANLHQHRRSPGIGSQAAFHSPLLPQCSIRLAASSWNKVCPAKALASVEQGEWGLFEAPALVLAEDLASSLITTCLAGELVTPRVHALTQYPQSCLPLLGSLEPEKTSGLPLCPWSLEGGQGLRRALEGTSQLVSDRPRIGSPGRLLKEAAHRAWWRPATSRGSAETHGHGR